ncbi:hypothetical protein PSYMP_17780, partial [Pseudomonas amygdali pv. morsprunorum str. M302280]
KALFYRDGTDDADCGVSDGGPRISVRAKEPDEAGPETERGGGGLL